MHPVNPLSANAPDFSNLLCLTPDNFTQQGENVANQLVKEKTVFHRNSWCKLAFNVLAFNTDVYI